MGSSFAKRFNQALSQREKSMADISRETGISRASLSQYSSGKYTPRQDRIYLIANALQVSPAWLTGFNTEMEDKPSKEKADNVIYTDEDFSLSSKTRQLKNGAEDFIGDQLLSLTEPARPSREEILKWIRENVRTAAYSGYDYEKMDDEKLYRFYKRLKQEAGED